MPYEEPQFIFNATDYTTSADTSSSAAEGGRSTPPTEYTSELDNLDSELPDSVIDPVLLADVYDPRSKKRKHDLLSSEPEDHNVHVSSRLPTLTGARGLAGHPPTRRFQSPFLPVSKKICPSNPKTSKYMQL